MAPRGDDMMHLIHSSNQEESPASMPTMLNAKVLDFKSLSLPSSKSVFFRLDRGRHEDDLPLEVEAKPIVSNSHQAEAYSVTIEHCSHEKRSFGSRDGVIGEAMVKLHVAPLVPAETNNNSKKKEAVWGLHDNVETVPVRDVRVIQQNAFPTKCRIFFDMYSSTVYGESGVTLTLALETCRTIDGGIPNIQIELVLGSED